MIKKDFFVAVDFEGKQVLGVVKIKDYLKAVRSMWHPNPNAWRLVPVWSINFDDYKNFTYYCPIDKIQILTAKRGD